MLYPVYVHAGDAQTAHGVTFPDFPGCFAAADDWEGLPAAIQEAVQAHFHEEPEAVPAPTPLQVLARRREYRGGVWLLAEVDLSRIETRAVVVKLVVAKGCQFKPPLGWLGPPWFEACPG